MLAVIYKILKEGACYRNPVNRDKIRDIIQYSTHEDFIHQRYRDLSFVLLFDYKREKVELDVYNDNKKSPLTSVELEGVGNFNKIIQMMNAEWTLRNGLNLTILNYNTRMLEIV